MQSVLLLSESMLPLNAESSCLTMERDPTARTARASTEMSIQGAALMTGGELARTASWYACLSSSSSTCVSTALASRMCASFSLRRFMGVCLLAMPSNGDNFLSVPKCEDFAMTLIFTALLKLGTPLKNNADIDG